MNFIVKTLFSIAIALPLSVNANTAPEEEKTAGYDVLKCGSFSWMENCDQINEQLKKNPNAPMRLKSEDGTEFNFPPGTPSAAIALMLDPSDANADAFLEHYENTMNASRKFGEAVQRAAARRGYQKAMASTSPRQRTSTPAEKIKINNTQLYVFVASDCTYCAKYLPKLEQLKRKLPSLKISLLQFDDNPRYLNEWKKRLGATGKILTRSEASRYISEVKQTPTTWFMNQKANKTAKIGGNISTSEIVTVLEEVSK